MTEYDFKLRFDVSRSALSTDEIIEALGAQGCTDALVGIGIRGSIALDFTREADSAEQALTSAITDVLNAIPGARLVEAGPDLVGLTEVADLFGKSRQNIRKLLVECSGDAPLPAHEGRGSSVWHLAPVLGWLRDEKHYDVDQRLIDVAVINMQLNSATVERRVALVANIAPYQVLEEA